MMIVEWKGKQDKADALQFVLNNMVAGEMDTAIEFELDVMDSPV